MPKVEGGCLCGNVRYSGETEQPITAVCHCKNCQKQAGSAFSILVGVPKASFEITGKSLTLYTDMADSGNQVERYFCNNCGSPVYSGSPTSPDMIFIKAGTLDDVSFLNPQVHVWCKSAQPWVQIDEAVPKFDGNP